VQLIGGLGPPRLAAQRPAVFNRLCSQDGWQSGRLRTLGKRVCSNAPRVRIPPHPPSAAGRLETLPGDESAAQRHRPTEGRPRRGEGRRPQSTFAVRAEVEDRDSRSAAQAIPPHPPFLQRDLNPRVRAVRQVASGDQSLAIRHWLLNLWRRGGRAAWRGCCRSRRC
jgi:hypothetical protein